MNTKKRNLKKKTGMKKNKVTKFQIKTFIFDVAKHVTDPEKQIDTPVNDFLKTVDVKDEDKILIDQGDGYVRISITYKVKVDKM